MKKKHLRSLNTVQKWLKAEVPNNMAIDEAFQVIRDVMGNLPDEVESDAELPAPLEISDEPQTLALFSDGGCRGNPGPGAFAFVVQTHGGEILTEGAEHKFNDYK